MGYYTRYELRIDQSRLAKKRTKYLEEIENSNLSESLKAITIDCIQTNYGENTITKDTVVNELGFDPFIDSCKWYNHDEDMRRISKIHPDVLYILGGFGEDPGDRWLKYYMNGKSQVEKIEMKFESFDETKLK